MASSEQLSIREVDDFIEERRLERALVLGTLASELGIDQTTPNDEEL